MLIAYLKASIGEIRRGAPDARHAATDRAGRRGASGEPLVPAADRGAAVGGGHRYTRRARRLLQPPRRSWWQAVPRIGAHRAQMLVSWLRRHARSIGCTVTFDIKTADPLALPVKQTVEAGRGTLVPLERLAVPRAHSGAQAFAYVRARHDLDAVRAYLHRHSAQQATQLAYRRELERLLPWATVERGTALSSMSVEDCKAYNAFLAAPSSAFCGAPASRTSGRWRPFAPDALSPESQRYAVRAILAAFAWLEQVRYLAGNP
ncbi:phage integrase family protein (plasmid) [Paraburkholderia sp. PREW-6R]|uniref:phage integrase family protein n=1 Tax=Paraburkholderia sp. PREW-6R TaxID=3141544 RepID=UPI0031F4A605